MRRFIGKMLPRLFLALFLLTASARAGVLHGTAWSVDVTPTRQTSAQGVKPFEDVLTFSRGRVVSANLQRFGIGAVGYSAHGGNGFYNWETVPILKKTRAANWGGVINGRNIDGNLKWVTSKGRVLYFTIKGRRK